MTVSVSHAFKSNLAGAVCFRTGVLVTGGGLKVRFAEGLGMGFDGGFTAGDMGEAVELAGEDGPEEEDAL